MTPPLLERPIRLDTKASDLLPALASFGPFCLQARTRHLQLSVLGDPAETLMTTGPRAWFPALGLEINRDFIAAVHASPLPTLPDHAGIVELDSGDGRGRVGFAVGTESTSRDRFHRLIGDFGLEEIESRHLIEWRRGLDAGFQMCPCCQQAALERRERPDLHPLTDILTHCAQLDLELLVEFGDEMFSLSTFFVPGDLDTRGAITVTSADEKGILRIDPLLLHALWILPKAIDGELRTVLQAFDPLGRRIFSLSCPDADQILPWQDYARAFYG